MGVKLGTLQARAKKHNSREQNATARLNIIKRLPSVQTMSYGNNLKSSELLFLSNLKEREKTV